MNQTPTAMDQVSADEKNVQTAPTQPEKPKKAKKLKEFRRVKTASPMQTAIPYIMVNRVGAQNFITDSVEIEKLEKYMKEKQADGMPNISMMHIMIAAYVRLVSQRPQLNRFIRGQRIWTRRNVEISLVIKKEMTLESPDTAVKITVPPDATLRDVYDALNEKIVGYRDNPGGSFDNLIKLLNYLPGPIFSIAVALLRGMDYCNLLPKFLTNLSPFHCSYFITSMGSLGIPPIYHHLYDFGTCPVFFAFGTKRRAYELDAEGQVKKKQYMDFTFVLDERICDGYYYASSLRLLKQIIRNPHQLDTPPETVVEDIR